MRFFHVVPLLLLAACYSSPDATQTYNGPESLLHQDQELISLPLEKVEDVKDLVAWIKDERPTSAVLECQTTSAHCSNAAKILLKSKVSFRTQPSASTNLAKLYYNRITAQDCDPRAIYNSNNVNNLQAQNFGCSVSWNAARMINTGEQLTDPAAVEGMDAKKSLSVIGAYQEGSSSSESSGSLLESSGSQ